MNNLIQSLPSPQLQRENYSHMDGRVMDGRWRDVGDDGDEDLLQISIPAGCQNGVSGSESRFLMVAAQRNSIWEKCRTLNIFRSEGICRRKERSRRRPSRPHNRWVWLGLGCAPCVCGGLVPLLRLVFWLRRSSGEIGFLPIFLEFLLKVGFLQKKRYQSNSAENNVSPC
jgi:hypothetical protein